MFTQGNLVFGRLNQNLKVDQRVVIGRTSDPSMDGLTGTVIGKSYTDPTMSTYIILLDTPYMGQKGVCLTEACLCPIDE